MTMSTCRFPYKRSYNVCNAFDTFSDLVLFSKEREKYYRKQRLATILFICLLQQSAIRYNFEIQATEKS